MANSIPRYLNLSIVSSVTLIQVNLASCVDTLGLVDPHVTADSLGSDVSQ